METASGLGLRVGIRFGGWFDNGGAVGPSGFSASGSCGLGFGRLRDVGGHFWGGHFGEHSGFGSPGSFGSLDGFWSFFS